MRVVYLVALFVLVSLIMVVSPQAGLTQTNACPALVELALEELGNNCADMPRNAACYGFNPVNSTFVQQMPTDFFAAPADRADLTVFQSIETAPLDVNRARWGIAVLKVQANIPNTLPGQAVIFMLLGDVQVDNAVPADEALLPAEPVALAVRTRTSLKSGPDFTTNTVGSVEAGTELAADGISPDGSWFRVLFEERPAWIGREVITSEGDLSSLPVIEPSSRTPMQAFQFRTGFGQPECEEAPSVLAVQSPENIVVDLTVNGANVRLGSLVTFQSQSGSSFSATVHEGHLETEGGHIVEQGETISGAVDEEGNLTAWADPRPATPDELQVGEIVFRAFQQIGTETGTFTPLTTQTTETTPCITGQNVTHVVAPGENLFRISLRYNTTVPAIAAANNITDTSRIFSGQSLDIPCGVDTGVPTIPQQSAQTPGIRCDGFRATSPTDGFANGPNGFTWDSPIDASLITRYRVLVYDQFQQVVASFEALAPSSSLTGDVGEGAVGAGFTYSWQTVALAGDQVACVSNLITLQREAAAPISQPPVVSAVCGDNICDASEIGTEPSTGRPCAKCPECLSRTVPIRCP